MQVTGRFTPHARGFGFVEPRPTATGNAPVVVDDNGQSHSIESAFVPPDLARGWLEGDVVTATLAVDEKGRINVTAMTLVTRHRRFVVGTAQPFAGRMVLTPDPRIGHGELQMSDELSTKLMYAEGKQAVTTVSPTGRATCMALVAGPLPAFAPSAVRARAVVVAHGTATPDSVPGGPEGVGLPEPETTTNVLRATGRMAAGQEGLARGLDTLEGPVPGPAAELQDLRGEVQVTIDADSSKDLDDAVSGAWSGEADDHVLVTVHIADAAGTVGIGSPADRYARTMAATSYFTAGPNAAMLDPALSEDELSLLPQQDRRAVSVRMLVDPAGNVTGTELGLSWIRPAARLSYAAVEAFLDDPSPTALAQGANGPNGASREELPHVTVSVTALVEASRRLGVARDARDTLESLFIAPTLEAVVEDGKIRTQKADPHPLAQQLVERLMVAANEAVAQWAVTNNVPLLYRSHGGFDPERVSRLTDAAEALGVPFESEPTPAGLVALVKKLNEEGQSDAATALATLATGVMARAGYTVEPSGHDALGAGAYTHFTSPLRRYADLVVHRQIRATLAGEPVPYSPDELSSLATWLDVRGGAVGYAESLERSALWSVLLERRALRFPTKGTIVGLSPRGLRIRMHVPGLVGFMSAARAMGEAPRAKVSLELAENELSTVDGKYTIGQPVRVRLDRLDPLGRPDLKLA